MKQILISIKTEHLVNILNGKKTLEIRKYIPKCLPCEVLIYCSKGKKKLFFSRIDNKYMYGEDTPKDRFNSINGKIVAKFTLKNIDGLSKYAGKFKDDFFYETLKKACVNTEYLQIYTHNKPTLYAWHIDNLVIFDKPKQLSDYGIKRAPQKYCYVKGE